MPRSARNRPRVDLGLWVKLSGDAELAAFLVCHGNPRVRASAAIPKLRRTAGYQLGDKLLAVVIADAYVEVHLVMPPFGRRPIGCWFARFPLGLIQE